MKKCKNNEKYDKAVKVLIDRAKEIGIYKTTILTETHLITIVKRT